MIDRNEYMTYSKSGIGSLNIEISHSGLHKHRHIKSTDAYIARQKATMQIAEWEKRWSTIKKKKALKERAESRLDAASEQTAEAQEALDSISTILASTLEVDDVINWEDLKDHSKFAEPRPNEPAPKSIPPCPSDQDEKFQPKFGCLSNIIPAMKQKELDRVKAELFLAQQSWERKKATREEKNEKTRHDYFTALASWESRKQEFLEKQATGNAAVEDEKSDYLAGNVDSITGYCDMVLANSYYPDWISLEWELEYQDDKKLLLIELSLPSPESLPALKEVRYIKSSDSFKESYITDAQNKKNYDSAIYQIVLRTLHEMFESDVPRFIESIALNGIVHTIDKSVGKKISPCIVSILVQRSEFEEIDLSLVEAKTCFKKLKGVGSAKLHEVAPIPPILHLNREDSRIVDSRETISNIDRSTNLATMNWEDFEHLVRDLFEKFFANPGVEVKVTQASRDQGVDAIVYDPDPIRGGKIVIQAKRYTNVVGVSAVRDLYGTVVNEGAVKGILITTSDYGADSYNFAKDKPLTLLNGANLLHLLHEHGHEARIDLAEAKKLQLEDR